MKRASRAPGRRDGGGLRVIAGRWRGRRLAAPEGLATRPLPDRIKQSLFDALGQDCSGWRVADVCAGSGSFGIEAASRGAQAVHLIEAGAPAQAVLRHNLASLGDPPALQLHPVGFVAVLPGLQDLDLVFADPPFPWYREDPERLGGLLVLALRSLRPEGRLLVRGETGTALPPLPPGLVEEDRRTYGRSWVVFLRRHHHQPPPAP